MNKKQTVAKIKSLVDQIDSLNEELQSLFEKELEELFKKYPCIKSVSAYVNNHEFNDGDETSFSFYYDDLTIHWEDELGNKYENNGYEQTLYTDERKEFLELFSSFDVNDFYEHMLGEYYETIDFKIVDGKLEIS